MVHCKSRMTICLLIAVAVTLMLGVAPAPTLAQEKVIKIGTIFPLTGPVALAGQRCKAAVETAVEILNNKHPNIKVPLLTRKAGSQGTSSCSCTPTARASPTWARPRPSA